MLGLQGKLFKEFVSIREHEADGRPSVKVNFDDSFGGSGGSTIGVRGGSMRGGISSLPSQARLKEHIHTLLTELPTMKEVLLLTPEWLGLNIEIKYPVEALVYGACVRACVRAGGVKGRFRGGEGGQRTEERKK